MRIVNTLTGAFVGLFFLIQGCVPHRLFYEPKDDKPGMKGVYVHDIFHSRDGRRIAKAIIYKNHRKLAELLEKQELVNGIGKYGITPLWVAVLVNNEEAVRMILDKGGNPNTDVVWVEPMMIEAARTDGSILGILLQNGGNPNEEFMGNLCLSYAKKETRSLGLLVAAGANVDQRNTSGKTPMILIAGRSHDVDKIIFLLEQGANPALRDNYGRTLVDIMDWRAEGSEHFQTHFSPVYQRLKDHGYSLEELRNPDWKKELELISALWEEEYSKETKKRSLDQKRAVEEWKRNKGIPPYI